jgi:hypothetical protein
VGDLFDAAWKANRKNYNLLIRSEQDLTRKAKAGDWLFLALLLLAIAALVALPILLVIWIFRTLTA